MNKPLKIPEYVLKEQYTSSDPKVSAWVSANAGSGKTHVLTQRVIRLLLAGNAPDRILCLTFTKAAAANMKTRVFDTLAKWCMMGDEPLRNAIKELTGQFASTQTITRARQLFALALDTPGGLKIQTIHAFCEALLHQFPLEANVPGHFETLQDTGQNTLLEQAKADVLAGRYGSEDLTAHFKNLVEAQTQFAIEEAITAIIDNRNAFMDWISGDIDEALKPLYAELGINPQDTEESIKQHCLETLPVPNAVLQAIADIAGESDKPTDANIHELLVCTLKGISPDAQFSALATACLKKDGEPKSESRIVTKFVKDKLPETPVILAECGQAIIAATEKLNALTLLRNSSHVFHIAEAIVERYASRKRQLGVVDFDDLVDKSANLLNRQDIREWIRYRLDRGIDHVLVDEAQDTSPKQWEIINAITADFHVGETAATRNRTVFVVGDEKQSIYSFQGARPQEFAWQQESLKTAVSNAQKQFHPGKLALSFRSTKDVLHAVDLVFKPEETRRGLMQSGEQPVHDAVREKDPGEVQVWPLYVKEKVEETKSWLEPIDHTSRSDPVIQLANRITETIDEWVGKPLPGSDEPLLFKDILVLVRKRDQFINAFTRTMKAKGLNVAGADRLVLTDHIAIEDLMAITQFVLLPEDDLSLACVLKGPLFDIEEDTLFDLAHDRNDSSLYDVISEAAAHKEHSHHKLTNTIYSKLHSLIQHAHELDVFEFFAWVLGPFGMRKLFLARLGSEVEDILDAFLDETIAFIREGGISLQGFLSALKGSDTEIKREIELERDEVRILTVHASKGLEAKVVFLIDPCNPPWTEKHRPAILPVTAAGKSGYLWLPSSDLHVEATRQATERIKSAAEEEYRRLLYVGMTRAADKLIVCGYRGINEPKQDTWHAMVQNALEDTAAEIYDTQGNPTGLRWQESPVLQPIEPKHAGSSADMNADKQSLPKWLTTPITHEKPLPAPLTPTGAYALIDKDQTKASKFNTISTKTGAAFALQKGKAIHRLLETLPDIQQQNREEIGKKYLERAGKDWTPAQRENVWSDIQSILENGTFSELFEGQSASEVSITGKLKMRSGERLIAGQIDRLVVQGDQVSIIDYKTNHNIPKTPDSVPHQYLTQIALYRELVQQVYPDKALSNYLLWVHGPSLMKLPDKLLDEALETIKNA